MIKGCFTCKHKNISFRKSPCDGCFLTAEGAYSEWEPMTNADRIRAMTDEELAEWFGCSESFCPDGFAETNDCDACAEVCTKHWLSWLKKEVKG